MHSLARLSNDFVLAEQEVLTLTESRIILAALRCIHTTDETLPTFAFRMKDVLDRINGNGRTLLHEAVRRLQVRKFLGTRLFSCLVAEDAGDTIAGAFEPTMEKHILYKHLKQSGYTQVNLAVKAFKSVHAYRLFWLLNNARNATEKTYTLDELRRLVLGDETKYATWNDLNRHVLCLVREEFEAAGYEFSYLELKKGNKVKAVTITIPDLSNPRSVHGLPATAEKTKVLKKPPLARENGEFVEAIRQYAPFYDLHQRLVQKYKLSATSAERVLRWINYDGYFQERMDFVDQALGAINRALQIKNIANLAAYTMESLKNVRTQYEGALSLLLHEELKQKEKMLSTQPAPQQTVQAAVGDLLAKFNTK